MLIDVHAHTSDISTCCRSNARDVLSAARGVGIEGLAITNHYTKSYIKDGDNTGFAQQYAESFFNTKKLGDEMGMRVLFGMEISVEYQTGVHLLVYGVAPDFVLRHSAIFDYSQKEIYDTVHESGGVLVQAHPFRGNKDRLQDLRFLDGLEVNSHPRYTDGTHFERISRIAEENGLIMTSGGDYHADTPRPHCGMYLPDTVTDGISLGEYIKNTNSVELLIQDYGTDEGRKVFFERKA